MPRKSNKTGGSFAYVEQFNKTENLSPCYNKNSTPKLGWHAGGSSCNSNLTVKEMGVVDTPPSNKPTASVLAWDNRYSQNGGNILKKINSNLHKKSSALSIEASKNGKNKIINLINTNDKFIMSVVDKESNRSYFHETNSFDDISKKIQQFNLIKINKSKKL